MYELRDYQLEAVETINTMEQGDRCLVSLPTGSGKTIIFADVASSIEGRTLIVVPSTELREQTIQKLKNTDPDLDIGSVQAKLDEVNSKIVVATRQSLTHSKSTRMERMLEEGEFEIVVFDEVHQAVDQVIKILNKVNVNAKVVGFTATPYNYDMNKVFSKIDYQKSLYDMIMCNYLCEPKALIVSSRTNLSRVKTQMGDFNQRELELTVNNEYRNDLIVRAYQEYASDRKATMIFASGIDHCLSITEEFNRAGIKCKSVDSKLDTDDREAIINEFRSGELPVICNVGILTTGFDHEPTDCIIFARPTKSRILYEQILGRGLRLWKDKEDCLIIDIQDVTKNHDLMSLTDVFEVDIKNGETLKDAIANRENEAEALKQLLAEKERKRQEELQLIAEQIKLFNSDMDSRFSEAYCDWYRCDATTFVLSCNSDNHYLIHKYGEEFEIYSACTQSYAKSMKYIDNMANILEAIDYVENKLIRKKNSYSYRDTGHIKTWKADPATPKQIEYVPSAKTKWDAHRYFTCNSIRGMIAADRRRPEEYKLRNVS